MDGAAPPVVGKSLDTRRRSSAASTDVRATRSSQALGKALYGMLRDRSLASISVAELCHEAGVHRTTFYSHYHDLFEFSVALYSPHIAELHEILLLKSSNSNGSVAAGWPLPTDELSLREALQHISAHRATYRVLFTKFDDAGFQRSLATALYPGVNTAHSREHLAIEGRTDWDAYTSRACVGVLEAWAHSVEVDAASWVASLYGVEWGTKSA